MQRLPSQIKAFLRDERGVIMAEALIAMPALIWGFLALVVYWDVFRVINVTQKAAYSIADTLSRQTVLTEDFVEDLDTVLTFLTPGAPASEMRITSLQLSEGATVAAGFDSNDSYCLLFSRMVGLTSGSNRKAYVQADLKALNTLIPDMANLESVVIVETWVDYEPEFDTGVLSFATTLTEQTFVQFVVTRPRNDRRVVLDGQAHTCP
jgi:hypothetical protein